MQNLQIEYKDISVLLPYINNSRTHSEEQVKQIASSIKEFGFTNPILIDKDNSIIAGHGRVKAAQLLNIKDVPTITLENLSDAQKKAYVIADNKLALNAGWDIELLKLEIDALKDLEFDISLLGFDENELTQIIQPEKIEGLVDEDEVPDVFEEPVTKLGDIWILGNHRLMCGDSTSIDAVDNLMNGSKADMVFTDPPYNVGFTGRSGNHEVIKNDNLTVNEFNTFINEFCNIIKIIKPKAYYIWCNWNFYSILQDKLDYKACIVWAKNVFGMGNGYRHQHEFCLFNGKIDEHIKNESDLWNIKKDTKYIHPTQKPVELAIRAFSNHIKYTKILDLFGGSGSTLIAGEQTNRNCYLMELDPKYCDVIIQRWQNYTGKEAVLESNGKTYKQLTNG